MNKKILYTVGAIIILGVAYWLISPLWRTVKLDESIPTTDNQATTDLETETAKMADQKIMMDEVMPAKATPTTLQGTLVASAHDVVGKVLVVTGGDKQYLRFEDLNTINGPDLRIYLATDLQASSIVDLGAIRATEGNVNYKIPTGTDLSKYKYALIWCRAFSVLFSYGELK